MLAHAPMDALKRALDFCAAASRFSVLRPAFLTSVLIKIRHGPVFTRNARSPFTGRIFKA